MYGTIHGPQSGVGDYNGGAGVGGIYTMPGGVLLADDFHLYAIEWTTNQIKWFIDGHQYFSATPANLPGGGTWVFTQPQFLILNLAVGGNWPGNPDGTTVFPQQMLVEYVRAYELVSAPPQTPTGLKVSPGNAKVFLSWDDSDAASYQVKRATNSGGPYVTVGIPTANNFTDVGVANCSTYYYVVSATNSLGASTNSSERVATLGSFSMAVNSGGGAAGHFGADAYVTGGTIGAVSTASIDTTGVVAPAPQAVYQAERYGNFTYTFPGLISGATYKVRLHSAETYWNAVGQRRFNLLINGAQVLTNFDIIAAAGGANRANVQEFNAVASGGQIVVQFVIVTDNARASGIEVILAQPPSPAGLVATSGDAQASLKWNALAGASYNVKRALASGGPYLPVFSNLISTNCTDAGLTNGTTYYYVVSAAVSGCESTNSQFVVATPICTPPLAPTATNNGPLWGGMTLRLTASTVPGATYSWSGPNGFTSTNQNPSIPNATANLSGVFSVVASGDECTSAPANTTVTINPPATVSAQVVGEALVLSWPGGTLQSAPEVDGPWIDVNTATSPYTNETSASREFYRLRME